MAARLVNTLSGGEQKKLAVRALLEGPEETLLLDEPDNYLDVPSKRWLEEVIKARTNGKGVDVVLEMSGSPFAIRQAMRIARPGGRVSMLGIPSEKVELDMAEDMIFKGLEIHCIVGRRLYQTWDTMRALLSTGKLDVRPAITHTLSMSEYDYGMSLMRDGLCGKVVFTQP